MSESVDESRCVIEDEDSITHTLYEAFVEKSPLVGELWELVFGLEDVP
jgi:hypothetical protein